jgi:hypothetical protein
LSESLYQVTPLFEPEVNVTAVPRVPGYREP